MLQIQLICIGKTNENYVQLALSKYQKLLSKYCKFNIIELADVKNGAKLDTDKLKQAEALIISNSIHTDAVNIWLDENGKTFDSTQFANDLEQICLTNSKINFIIGGAFGLHASLKQKGQILSLSSMTFNHQMVRIILAEQLFRAFTIIKNTSYHH